MSDRGAPSGRDPPYEEPVTGDTAVVDAIDAARCSTFKDEVFGRAAGRIPEDDRAIGSGGGCLSDNDNVPMSAQCLNPRFAPAEGELVPRIEMDGPLIVAG